MKTYRILSYSIIATLSFIIFSCETHKVVLTDRCVNKLKRQLVGYWDYNADKKLYKEKKNTFHLVYSKKFLECLQNMHKSDLIKVFGIPTTIVGNRMFYRTKHNENMGVFVKLNDGDNYDDFGYFRIQRKDTSYVGEKNIVNYK